MKRPILGYQLDSAEAIACVDEIFRTVASSAAPTPDAARWLACLNPHSYCVALDDEPFARALRDATWLIPDGIGVVWASHALGYPVAERVTGYDIFVGLLERMQAAGGGSVFLLGSTEQTLDLIAARLTREYPLVTVCGAYAPPYAACFSVEENDNIAGRVNAACPDALFVGLSAPKQEKWIHQMQGRLQTPFIAAIGAVFDFYGGSIKRSSPVFQQFGLEWLPRLLQEPRRLWRRSFISAPRFVWAVVVARLHRR